jgi:nucleoside-diphosphate-sugar epimerase
MTVLVIGGTMFIGRALVKELSAAGHEVTVVHRKARHDLGRAVHNLTADRNDAESMKRALGDRQFEVVFDNVYDWERGTTADQVEATARLCAGRQLQRYIFMSSVAAYGDGLNHHESDALAPDDHRDSYVRNKAMSERALFRLHQRIGLPVVTFRPPFIYGPGNPYYREAFFWDRMRDNRAIIIPGDGRRLMQFVYVKDVVRACIKAMDQPGSTGHAFNIANPRPVTQIEAVQAMAEAAGKKAQLVRVPRERLIRAGGHPMGPKLYFAMYFDVPPITEVITKAQRILRFRPTDFADGLDETYRWYARQRTRARPDYSFEDSVLARAPGIDRPA